MQRISERRPAIALVRSVLVTNLRRERQAEGIAAAKQRATYRGRPPSIDMEAIKHRLAMGAGRDA